jgi:mannose-6-phosphate isomerase
MNPAPIRINPTFSPRIWGAKSLAPLYPEKTDLSEPIGEAWLTDVSCRIATGPFAGKTLAEAWREMPAEWRGTNFAEPSDFPLLLKFIFPTDKLSIQVHPNDAYASIHEKSAGGRGKTEMWHVVSAQKGASLLAGLKPGVTKEQFRQAIDAHQNLEGFFESYEVREGDTFFISAGTPHTIGPNMIICEVQEYSDLTYRIYDYGRVDAHGKPRELHIEKALEVINFSGARTQKVRSLPFASSAGSNSLLAACRYFAAERWSFESPFSSPSHYTRFDLLTILSGHGSLHCGDCVNDYMPGECWLIPAILGMYEFRPAERTSLVHAYVPNLPRLSQQLYHAGFNEDQLACVLFK